MLTQLDIRNYTIIEEVSVRFSDKFNVITGETGAGKSILLGALSLILGIRADSGTLRDKNKKAIVEGIFQLPEREEISTFFSENQLDYVKETILRREISPSGKSRSFINDTPVNLQQLSAFGSLLVDLHQQFDTLQIGQSDFQFHVLDSLAGQKNLLETYRKEYFFYIKQHQLYKNLEEKAQRLSRESDYDRFLLNELEDAGLADNELEDLNEELQTLSHTEELKRNLESVTFLIETGDNAILSQLKQVQNQLNAIVSFYKSIPSLSERLSSVKIELQDISDELQQINNTVGYDDERIAFIQDRINTGYKLLKKHQFRTTQELIDLQNTLQQKLSEAENVEEELLKARREKEKQRKKVEELAEQLTQGRQKQVQPFITNLQKLLARVGMVNARMNIVLKKHPLTATGQDEISFEFDANKSGHFLPVRKVASGGELSRLMLCIKSMIAHSATLPTLIFDEIESGISGEAARQVGLLLNELGTTHQVICISHQPQVAAKAQTHFQIYKTGKNGKIISGIRQLNEEERIRIIAQMMSGDQPTTAALANAKELMER